MSASVKYYIKLKCTWCNQFNCVDILPEALAILNQGTRLYSLYHAKFGCVCSDGGVYNTYICARACMCPSICFRMYKYASTSVVMPHSAFALYLGEHWVRQSLCGLLAEYISHTYIFSLVHCESWRRWQSCVYQKYAARSHHPFRKAVGFFRFTESKKKTALLCLKNVLWLDSNEVRM